MTIVYFVARSSFFMVCNKYTYRRINVAIYNYNIFCEHFVYYSFFYCATFSVISSAADDLRKMAETLNEKMDYFTLEAMTA